MAKVSTTMEPKEIDTLIDKWLNKYFLDKWEKIKGQKVMVGGIGGNQEECIVIAPGKLIYVNSSKANHWMRNNLGCDVLLAIETNIRLINGQSLI